MRFSSRLRAKRSHAGSAVHPRKRAFRPAVAANSKSRRRRGRPLQLQALEERHLMAIDIANLRLMEDTGPSATDGITFVTAIEGDVVGTGETAFALVEVDVDGDALADAATLADAQSHFTFTASGLPDGAVSLAARTVAWSESLLQYQYGNWTSLNFTLVEPAPVALSQVTLLNDTGPSSTDGLTCDPRLTGAVAWDGAPGQAQVEFDRDGDSLTDHVLVVAERKKGAF